MVAAVYWVILLQLHQVSADSKVTVRCQVILLQLHRVLGVFKGKMGYQSDSLRRTG